MVGIECLWIPSMIGFSVCQAKLDSAGPEKSYPHLQSEGNRRRSDILESRTTALLRGRFVPLQGRLAQSLSSLLTKRCTAASQEAA